MYFNQAIVLGNLTRDPEIRSLPSGVPVASFGLATNRVWKDKNGARQEDTQFHNIVVFGSQADIVAKYLKKGGSVLIEGRMQTRSWDGPDGAKKYRTEIVAERLQLGPRRDYGGGAPSGGGETTGNQAAPAKAEKLDTIEYPTEEINPDDIPF